MSYQTQQLVAALPGTLPELAERTGYPIVRVLGFIIDARVEGIPLVATQQPRPELTVFSLYVGSDPATLDKPAPATDNPLE